MLLHRTRIFGGIILALALITQPAAALFERSARVPQAVALTNAIQSVSTGAEGRGGGSYAAISETGQYVIFESYASDLVSGHVDDSWDVFAHNLNNHAIHRISTRTGGEPVYNPGDYTSPPVVNDSGRFIAFISRSDTLVSNDSNGMPDIFLHDRNNRSTRLVSVGTDGSAANGQSFTPAVSDNGRFVAFQSMASNLVADDTNEAMDVFVRDMQTDTTTRISVSETGEQGSEPTEYGFPSVSISGGGRYVAFSYQFLPVANQPSMLGPSVYLHDRQENTISWISYGSMPNLSNDGRLLLFVTTEPLVAADTNESADVYLFDQLTAAFERISIPHNGGETGPQDIYSPADISDDGRFVVFESNGNLLRSIGGGVSNIYLRDRQLQTIMLVTRALDGGPANDESHYPAISGNGSRVAFNSSASNLIENDANATPDVFLFTRTTPGLFSGEHEYYVPVFLMVD